MVGLRDIGPLTRTIKIRGNDVTLRGLSARGLVELIDRFPEVRKLMSGRGGNLTITVDQVLALAPDVLGTIMAVGLGAPGDPETEQNAQMLMVGEQAEIIAEMLELTFGPKGLAHFQRILDLVTVPAGDSDGTGKGLATKLPSHFNSAFSTGTPQKPSGDTPQGNSGDGPKSSPEGSSPPAPRS